jgi:hypothetical protein
MFLNLIFQEISHENLKHFIPFYTHLNIKEMMCPSSSATFIREKIGDSFWLFAFSLGSIPSMFP